MLIMDNRDLRRRVLPMRCRVWLAASTLGSRFSVNELVAAGDR